MTPVHVKAAPTDVKRLAPGTWRGAPGFVVVCCPWCAVARAIPEGHQIEQDGHVEPSLQCQTTWCDFDFRVHLDGWQA